MKKPLTENEKEILDFYTSHTCKETMVKFGVAEWKIHSLKERQKRLEEEKEEGKPRFIEIPRGDVNEMLADGKGSVSFMLGKRTFTMSLRDFRRAFLDD